MASNVLICGILPCDCGSTHRNIPRQSGLRVEQAKGASQARATKKREMIVSTALRTLGVVVLFGHADAAGCGIANSDGSTYAITLRNTAPQSVTHPRGTSTTLFQPGSPITRAPPAPPWKPATHTAHHTCPYPVPHHVNAGMPYDRIPPGQDLRTGPRIFGEP